MKAGDLATEEPTTVGTVVRDRDGDLSRLNEDGTWTRGLVWASIARYEPLTVVSVPSRPTTEPVQASVEQWETVAADQVQVGDHIEVTREHDGGATCTFAGPVTAYDGPRRVVLGVRQYVDLLMPRQTIRRRVRPPMAEPKAPAVVRHGGQLWVRMEMCSGADPTSGRSWWALSLRDGYRASAWLTWAEVLALDPTTQPVVIDLGDGA